MKHYTSILILSILLLSLLAPFSRVIFSLDFSSLCHCSSSLKFNFFYFYFSFLILVLLSNAISLFFCGFFQQTLVFDGHAHIGWCNTNKPRIYILLVTVVCLGKGYCPSYCSLSLFLYNIYIYLFIYLSFFFSNFFLVSYFRFYFPFAFFLILSSYHKLTYWLNNLLEN